MHGNPHQKQKLVFMVHTRRWCSIFPVTYSIIRRWGNSVIYNFWQVHARSGLMLGGCTSTSRNSECTGYWNGTRLGIRWKKANCSTRKPIVLARLALACFLVPSVVWSERDKSNSSRQPVDCGTFILATLTSLLFSRKHSFK